MSYYYYNYITMESVESDKFFRVVEQTLRQHCVEDALEVTYASLLNIKTRID